MTSLLHKSEEEQAQAADAQADLNNLCANLRSALESMQHERDALVQSKAQADHKVSVLEVEVEQLRQQLQVRVVPIYRFHFECALRLKQ